jgi:hypothetical protein
MPSFANERPHGWRKTALAAPTSEAIRRLPLRSGTTGYQSLSSKRSAAMAKKNQSEKAPAASSSTNTEAAKEVEAMQVGEPQSGDGGNADVQAKMDEATEKGYFGITTDPTPNENYTIQGVSAGKPTPETDPKQAAKVAEHQAKVRAGTVEDKDK